MNRKIILLITIFQFCGCILLGCNENSTTKIEFSENSIFLNGIKITKVTSLDTYKKIIGEPSRTKIATQEEIKDAIKKFGCTSANFYSYDNLGIMLTQDPLSEKIEDIVIVYNIQKYDYYPLHIFSGKLIINGKEINKNSSLTYLKTINDLALIESIVSDQPAKIFGYDLSFHYAGITTKTELETFSVSMLYKTNDSNGWNNEDFNIIKASLINNPNAQKMTKENNLSLDKLGDCYTKKLMLSIKKLDFIIHSKAHLILFKV